MTLEEEVASVNAVELTAEQEADIDEAVLNATDPAEEDVALTACYDFPTRMLLLGLKSGQRLAIPVEDLQTLSDAEADVVAEVEIEGPLGLSVWWKSLDMGFRIRGLRQGVYGNERWMDGLARRRRETLLKAG